MEEFERLKRNFRQLIEITDEDFDQAKNYFSKRKLRKQKELLVAGERSKYFAYIVTGGLKCFTLGNDDIEHVFRFAFENEWMGGAVNLYQDGYLGFFKEAIEDSDLLLITHEGLEELCLKLPILERFFRLLAFNFVGQLTLRYTSVISETAEKRYHDLIRREPKLIEKIPLYSIASYLGITPESLSRIRRKEIEDQ